MSNPYQSPQFASQPTQQMPFGVDREKLRRVAKYQQWVIFALLVNIGVNVASMAARQADSVALTLGLLGVALIAVAFSMVSIFLLANELYGTGLAVLSAILMIVPCISLITLLVVNGKATAFLQQNGIKVGFFGTSPSKV